MSNLCFKTFLLIILSALAAIVAIILTHQPDPFTYSDLNKTIQELIESRGFDHETHFVQSPDGYILQTIRIVNPYVRNRTALKPILLHHGFQCTGSVWLVASNGTLRSDGSYYEESANRNDSNAIGNTLGFVLAARGYDVWLANYRGNIYSSNHTQIDTEDEQFWQFNMDDMIEHDLPALVEYIRAHTRKSTIAYIGHSQGSYMMLSLLSKRPHFSSKVKPFIAISPVAYFTRFESPIVYLQLFNRQIFGLSPNHILTNSFRKYSIPRLCTNPLFLYTLCHAVYYVSTGSHRAQIDFNRLPIYIDNLALGSSTQNFVHLFQHKKGFPTYYDYGNERANYLKYGQAYPPVYKLGNINSSDIAIIYTKRDWFNHLVDVQLLRDNLNVKLMDDYAVPDPTWNHKDLIWGKEVGKYVNSRVLKVLDRY